MNRPPQHRRLDPGVERRRRLNTLLVTVPGLLNELLKPLLGAGRFPFMVRVLALAPAYHRRFARATDDAQLRAVKRTFLLVGVLHHQLVRRLGEPVALATTREFLYRLACSVQRKAYFPPAGQEPTWEHFHLEHEAQMEEGFISTNENGGVFHTDSSVTLQIVRCRFHECFRDMGEAAITEAFCRSDETVFNEYSPRMRFHRGAERPDTIARGAARCSFIYERVLPPPGVATRGDPHHPDCKQ
ncbi:L-2-amino-thiazoline-4-carboxylic acid hydrolase [Caldimonas tepidiphila]|uniref:L-2-amino-thiazoline-4-carboxylic acid hydrolase n=1 Tax=Caldimonas tepidiphila TaxID=2315841 RepID=UPI000E5BE7FC|nr:L-2-amino-thiazoline-4-carboxylic acid hydrolase [Caldimonas tepidiphila]